MAPRQRKLTRITIDEVSGVNAPAHLVEGWVIRKDAGNGGLPDGAVALKIHEEALVASILRGVKNGEAIEFPEAGEGAQLGKSQDGTAFILTPAAIEKAAGNKWAAERGVAQRPSQRS